MRIENAFDVELPIEQAWPMLLDVPAIVPCMPGAELLEALPDTTYKGKVSLKLGPVVLAFQGTARLTEVDEAARVVKLDARGTDQRGRGGANAKVVFSLAPQAGSTRVEIVTDLQLSGTVAQYGRAQGVVKDVAQELVNQFAECLAKKIRVSGAAAASGHAGDERDEAVARAEHGVPVHEARPLSVLGLIWRVLVDKLRAMFSRGGSR